MLHNSFVQLPDQHFILPIEAFVLAQFLGELFQSCGNLGKAPVQAAAQVNGFLLDFLDPGLHFLQAGLQTLEGSAGALELFFQFFDARFFLPRRWAFFYFHGYLFTSYAPLFGPAAH